MTRRCTTQLEELCLQEFITTNLRLNARRSGASWADIVEFERQAHVRRCGKYLKRRVKVKAK